MRTMTSLKNEFAAFEVQNNSFDFNVIGIYGKRKSINTGHPAFLFSAYYLFKNKDTANILPSFTEFKETHGVKIESNNGQWIIYYDQNSYCWNKQCDIIQFIKMIYEGKNPCNPLFDSNGTDELDTQEVNRFCSDSAIDSSIADDSASNSEATKEEEIEKNTLAQEIKIDLTNAVKPEVSFVTVANTSVASTIDYRRSRSRPIQWLSEELTRWFSHDGGNKRSVPLAFALHYRIAPNESERIKRLYRGYKLEFLDYGIKLGELIRDMGALELGVPISAFDGKNKNDRKEVINMLATILREYEAELGHQNKGCDIYSSLLGLKYDKAIIEQGVRKAGIGDEIIRVSKIHEKYNINANGYAVRVGYGVRRTIEENGINFDDFIRECQLPDDEFFLDN